MTHQNHQSHDEKSETRIMPPSCPIITTTNMLNTNLNNITHNKGRIQRVQLKICKHRLIRECRESFSNPDLTLIPIAMDQNMRKWPDSLGIVAIDAVEDSSQRIYLGVKYGYGDSKKLFEISEGLKKELHDDEIRIIVEFTMELTIKEWILEPLEFMHIIDNYHIDITKYKEWVKNKTRYNKWVTNIEINDFDDDVQQIIDKFSLNQIKGDKLRECFAENTVNYRYLEHHSRREFVQLLQADPYLFSIGESIKIYGELSQIREIVIS